MFYNLYLSKKEAENAVKKIIRELRPDWKIVFHKEIKSIPPVNIILETGGTKNKIKGLAYYRGKENSTPPGNYSGFLIKIAGPLMRNKRKQTYEIIYRLAWKEC